MYSVLRQQRSPRLDNLQIHSLAWDDESEWNAARSGSLHGGMLIVRHCRLASAHLSSPCVWLDALLCEAVLLVDTRRGRNRGAGVRATPVRFSNISPEAQAKIPHGVTRRRVSDALRDS